MKSCLCSSTTVTENHLRKIRGTVSYSLRFYIFLIGSAISALGLQLMQMFWEVVEPLGGRPRWRKFILGRWAFSLHFPSLSASWSTLMWTSGLKLLLLQPWASVLLIPCLSHHKTTNYVNPLPLSSFLPGVLRHNKKVTDTVTETKQSKYRTFV